LKGYADYYTAEKTMVFTLIGMPGSGKSCMSRALSNKIEIKTVDSDRLIEERIGKKLCEIIAEDGNEAFKKIEEDTLMSIEDADLLLATGGSAIYSDKAMLHLKNVGKLIYLYVSFDTMIKRIGDYKSRGIVMRADQTIKDLYDERTALYEKYADYTVNCDGTDYPKYRKNLLDIIQKEMNL